MKTKLLLFFFLLNFTLAFSNDWQTSGNYSISWYNKNESSFIIKTNKELAGVAYLVNNGFTTFKNKTIIINDDISLEGKLWISIGFDKDHKFEGTLDGNKHLISGIYINENSASGNCGFFGTTKGANINRLRLSGDIELNKFRTNIGSLVGYCELTNIDYCIINFNIKLDTGSLATTDYSLNMGGLIGQTYNMCRVSYCLFEGSINAILGDIYEDNYFTKMTSYMGGIVGRTYNSDIICCQSDAELLRTKLYRSHNSANYSTNIGGIVGFYSGEKLKYCTSRGKLLGEFYSTNNTIITNTSLGGIAASCSSPIINCYSPETDFEVYSQSYNTIVYYGGITASSSDSKFKSNYSPSDLYVNTSQTKIHGYDGSTSFSSQQMTSDNFLEELNMYSVIEDGKAVWSKETGYPYIPKIYTQGESQSDEIEHIYSEPYNTKYDVYDLTGKFISKGRETNNFECKPGIYIFKSSANKSKKIVVK